jgi:hypothetical protein
MEYWDHSCSIWLKNNTVHGINKSWIEKTLIQTTKLCVYDHYSLAQTEFRVRAFEEVYAYHYTRRSDLYVSRALRGVGYEPEARTGHDSNIPSFHIGGIKPVSLKAK